MIANPDDFDPDSALLDSVFAGLSQQPAVAAVDGEDRVRLVADSPRRLSVGGAAHPCSDASPRRPWCPARTTSKPKSGSPRSRTSWVRRTRASPGATARCSSRSLDAWKGSAGRQRARRELSVIDRIGRRVRRRTSTSPTRARSRSRRARARFRSRSATTPGDPCACAWRWPATSSRSPGFRTRRRPRDQERRPYGSACEPGRPARSRCASPSRRSTAGLAISDTRFRIRSTAVSTVGIALDGRRRALPRGMVGLRHPPATARRRRRTAAVSATAHEPVSRAVDEQHDTARASAEPDTGRILRSSAVVGVGTALSRATGLPAGRGDRVRARRVHARRRLQLRERDPEHRLRAPARRRAHRDARSAVRHALRGPRRRSRPARSSRSRCSPSSASRSSASCWRR